MAIRDLARVEIRSRAEWRAWLAAYHTQSASIWLVTFKKKPGAPHVPYPELVEEALCFGWIDSRAGAVDDARSMVLMSPRRKGSAWSRLNKERVARLDAAGLLHEAGRARIAEAQADGSWTALDDVEAGLIPDAVQGQARQALLALTPSARRGWLDRYRQAKTPATRQRRIAELVALR